MAGRRTNVLVRRFKLGRADLPTAAEIDARLAVPYAEFPAHEMP